MRAYRIFDHERPWARVDGFDPFDGEGAMHGPARWHHKGTRVAYAAANPSLALLEILVHMNPADFGEKTLQVAELPDDAVEDVGMAQIVQLLRDAADDARERASRDFGTAWAREGRSLALRVPSLVMPHDRNVILNPLHPRMREVSEVRRERVSLDPRLRLARLEAAQ
ncbi:MAG: RES family NAD+ phosphorylase [Trueperaceae bacterium]|nr:RES family NAD+ phosphorylase [Trueperaceae bacterium]